MSTWRASEHEKTAKHERAVKRYIDTLNAANRSESAPSGVHQQHATNPFMDAFYDAVKAQPRRRVSPRHSPSNSPPLSTPMDVDHPDNLPAHVPMPVRQENRRIRAAVDSALKSYLDSSVIDGSDSDESHGDVSEDHAAPVHTQCISPSPFTWRITDDIEDHTAAMRPRQGRGRARTGTGPWRPWPDRTVSISVTIVLQH
jgi:hypothetical protein